RSLFARARAPGLRSALPVFAGAHLRSASPRCARLRRLRASADFAVGLLAAMTHEITLLPGDGIGPEITRATLRVLEAAGIALATDEQKAGLAAVEAHGEPMPRAVLDSIRRTGVALKGPLATPSGVGFRSVNVALRQEFDLYANVRPVRTLFPGRYRDVDLVLVRENTEGLYVG